MRFVLMVLVLSGVVAPFHVRAESPEQVAAYIEKAKVLNLAQDPAWLALLHYKHESLTGRYISQADDDVFFLARKGKTHPDAELEADIRAFLEPAGAGHKQCYFPARWHWLKQQLGFSSRYDVPCPKLEAWIGQVSTQRLSLVFPSMYLGNPGSMFGHTFLRFDDSNDVVLLSQALNYAAAIDPEDNFVRYAYNGLLGGYPGVFNTRRYFETVQLYSHIENRDIWEYQLDFSPEEIKQLARHAWELSGVRFDYFFFRENCAYRLLAMLDAVRPGAALTSGSDFRWYAIPVDTVRALDEKKLIKARHYRPSLASQLKAAFDQHASLQNKLTLQLAESDISIETTLGQFENESLQSVALEQAYTLLEFRHQAQGERAQALLRHRSRLTGQSLQSVEAPASPETGHASSRVALGAGKQNHRSYTDIVLRPAFHDWLDSPLGYSQGSEINVFDMQLRWFPDNDLLLLESLRFFNAAALNPVTQWYRPASWQLDIRLDRKWLDPFTSDMSFLTRAGGGYSTRWSHLTVFGMAMLEADVTDLYEKSYSTSAGFQVGALVTSGVGQLLVFGETGKGFAGAEIDKDTVSAQVQFNFGVNHAIRIAYSQTRYPVFKDEEAYARWQYYF